MINIKNGEFYSTPRNINQNRYKFNNIINAINDLMTKKHFNCQMSSSATDQIKISFTYS